MKIFTEKDLYISCLSIDKSYSFGLIKEAEFSVSNIINAAKDYFSSKIDTNNPSSSVINLLTYGAVDVFLGSIGFGFFTRKGLALLLNIFGIDVASALKEISNNFISGIKSGKTFTNSDVHNVVKSSVDQYSNVINDPSSPEELHKRLLLVKKQAEKYFNIKIIKNSYNFMDFKNSYNSKKQQKQSILSKLLSILFKIILSSAGLMIASDVVKKITNKDKPNDLDKPLAQLGLSTELNKVEPISLFIPSQTKFKLNPGYHEENYNQPNNPWIEKIKNEKNSIENMVLSFAKEVYQDLNNIIPQIKNTAGFKLITNLIAKHNVRSEGDNIIFIPKPFTSKKKIVDIFIDELAKATA